MFIPEGAMNRCLREYTLVTGTLPDLPSSVGFTELNIHIEQITKTFSNPVQLK